MVIKNEKLKDVDLGILKEEMKECLNKVVTRVIDNKHINHLLSPLIDEFDKEINNVFEKTEDKSK